MSERPHPLDGVLDKLLSRERSTRESEIPARSVSRRMIAMAGFGDLTDERAARSLAVWAVEAGRSPAMIDLAEGDGTVLDPDGGRLRGGGGTVVPVAVLPATIDRLQAERTEVKAAVIERVRRIEISSDLLLLRVPARRRMLLMKAAFMAGGLVIPLAQDERVLAEAYRLSRETLECFNEVELWPLPLSDGVLDKYHSMSGDFLGTRPDPIGQETLRDAGFLGKLQQPPEEGFIHNLLQEQQAAPPPDLLRIGSIIV